MRVCLDFRFGVIGQDPDDNKFVDCAIAADAEFIVPWARAIAGWRKRDSWERELCLSQFRAGSF